MIIIFRMVERIIGVLIGGVLIYFGYRLFLCRKPRFTYVPDALHTLQPMWSVRKLGLPSFLTEGTRRQGRARLGRD